MADLDYGQRLRALVLESLELRRLKADLVLVYKLLHGHVTVENRAKFIPLVSKQPSVRVGIRGHTLKLLGRKFNHRFRENFFTVRVVSMWNALQLDVVRMRV